MKNFITPWQESSFGQYEKAPGKAIAGAISFILSNS
jgi:hypothetical protein